MKQHLLIAFLFCVANQSFAQQKQTNQLMDIAATAGSSRGAVALSYVYNWQLGKKQKWEFGLGARFTSAFGTKQDFITAPARLSRTSTIPFITVLSGQQEKNWDTLTVQRPLVNSLNITANFGYQFNARWNAGFNIDLIGFAFGRVSPAILTSNGSTTTEPAAKPSSFNLLLTGDLDHGNLNSEFFVGYKLNEQWSIRAVYQFIFTEYKTTTTKQIAPDGTEVNRFRMKANNLGLAVSYHF